jgi:hypothetical protein
MEKILTVGDGEKWDDGLDYWWEELLLLYKERAREYPWEVHVVGYLQFFS